ncbi:hypothetical protein KIN20_027807 [Parelaphostrongylus tenuis]|uniref:Uncharacterized protein n=1 Tax=Parelaphostrongylus tenuis TaxID=148309 RepID=A0AAD5WE32_PARTN|nr:hypothetical protein KIN20_027807 [Parelaphostrongylus tenuis]
MSYPYQVKRFEPVYKRAIYSRGVIHCKRRELDRRSPQRQDPFDGVDDFLRSRRCLQAYTLLLTASSSIKRKKLDGCSEQLRPATVMDVL